MSPEEFKEQWSLYGEATVPVKAEILISMGLGTSSAGFLSISGLPESAAPFLSFAEIGVSNSCYCARLTELYDFLPKDYMHYISIGSDGAGDPIAIDTSDDDRVVWLDHEDGFTKRYMNSSVCSLAAFLLVYRDFVHELIGAKGDDAFFDGDYTQEEFDMMRIKLERLDPKALQEGHFWETEMRTLSINRR